MGLQQGSIWGSITRLFRLRDVVAAETHVGSFLGAEVYRKVLTVAAGPNGSTVDIAHGITGLAAVVGMQGHLTNGTTIVPLPGAADLTAALGGTNLSLTSASANYSGYSGAVEILYTKG